MTDTSEELWAHVLEETQRMKRETRPKLVLAKKTTVEDGLPRQAKEGEGLHRGRSAGF